jgi:hypothetical protein
MCRSCAARPLQTRDMLQSIATSRAIATTRLMVGNVAIEKCFPLLRCNVIEGKDSDDARCSLAP